MGLTVSAGNREKDSILGLIFCFVFYILCFYKLGVLLV